VKRLRCRVTLDPSSWENVTDNGADLKIKGVDFGDTGAAKFSASLATIAQGNTIMLRIDSEVGLRYPSGQLYESSGQAGNPIL
jgi:hypothetical protein